ncbi:MAG: hypothetical protein WC437_01600 [Patescibacteria group bacterium]|jgi:hypothetical protein|nr:hypothetical protein [Patescibacteria group bacterium]
MSLTSDSRISVSRTVQLAIEEFYKFKNNPQRAQVFNDWQELGVYYREIELGKLCSLDRGYKKMERWITFYYHKVPYFRVLFRINNEQSKQWVVNTIQYRTSVRFTDKNLINENEWFSLEDPSTTPIPEFRQFGDWYTLVDPF